MTKDYFCSFMCTEDQEDEEVTCEDCLISDLDNDEEINFDELENG